MSSAPQLTARAHEMYAIIEKYLSCGRTSSLTQKAFCEQEGIRLTTFQWWLVRYRKQKRLAGKGTGASGGFIPVVVQEPVSQRADSAGHWEIEYPNGVVLRISSDKKRMDLDLLAALLTCLER
jgi:hypothetical protein